MNSLSLRESRALARRGPIRVANDERSPKQQTALSGRYRVRLSHGESEYLVAKQGPKIAHARNHTFALRVTERNFKTSSPRTPLDRLGR